MWFHIKPRWTTHSCSPSQSLYYVRETNSVTGDTMLRPARSIKRPRMINRGGPIVVQSQRTIRSLALSSNRSVILWHNYQPLYHSYARIYLPGVGLLFWMSQLSFQHKQECQNVVFELRSGHWRAVHASSMREVLSFVVWVQRARSPPRVRLFWGRVITKGDRKSRRT